MITLHDLDEAIMECLGKKSPDANTCIMLAAFYTIKHNLYPEKEERPEIEPIMDTGYAYTSGPDITYSGESEFSQVITGKDQNDVFPVIDELMETVKILNPRLYAGVIRRLKN